MEAQFCAQCHGNIVDFHPVYSFQFYVSAMNHKNSKLKFHAKFLCFNVHTVLPRITAWVFISFQQFLTRPQNETDNYYRKKHVLFM